MQYYCSQGICALDILAANRMLILKLILTTAISVDNSKTLQIGVWLNANLSEIQCNQRERVAYYWVGARFEE